MADSFYIEVSETLNGVSVIETVIIVDPYGLPASEAYTDGKASSLATSITVLGTAVDSKVASEASRSNSYATSLNTLSTSRVTSLGVIVSSNLVTGDSKALSLSTIISTNKSLATPSGGAVQAAVIGPTPTTGVVDNMIPAWDGTSARLVKAGYTVGTGANNLVQLTAAGKYPAIDGSLITGIVVGGGTVGLQCYAMYDNEVGTEVDWNHGNFQKISTSNNIAVTFVDPPGVCFLHLDITLLDGNPPHLPDDVTYNGLIGVGMYSVNGNPTVDAQYTNVPPTMTIGGRCLMDFYFDDSGVYNCIRLFYESPVPCPRFSAYG